MPAKRSLVPAPIIMRGLTCVLVSHGVAFADALSTARVLVEGTARGYIDHGVERIFQTLDGIRRGSIDPKAQLQIEHSAAATATIDACRGLGPAAGRRAMRLATDIAHRCGVGVVGVRNCGHLGILAYYAELAVRGCCFGMVFSTSSPAVCLPGGTSRVLGTNPLAYAVRFGEDRHEVLSADFATSNMTRSALIRSREEGRPLAAGQAVDEFGRFTPDPDVGLTVGGLLPIGGGIKGALLNTLVSLLAGPLVGAPPNLEVTGTRYMDHPPNKGDLFLAIDIAAFTQVDMFRASVRRQIDAMRQSSAQFHVPGFVSMLRRRESMRRGLEVSPELARLLGKQ